MRSQTAVLSAAAAFATFVAVPAMAQYTITIAPLPGDGFSVTATGTVEALTDTTSFNFQPETATALPADTGFVMLGNASGDITNLDTMLSAPATTSNAFIFDAGNETFSLAFDGLAFLPGDTLELDLAYEVAGGGSIGFSSFAVGSHAVVANSNPNYATGNGTVVVVPEPATLALLGLGGLAMLRRRRK